MCEFERADNWIAQLSTYEGLKRKRDRAFGDRYIRIPEGILGLIHNPIRSLSLSLCGCSFAKVLSICLRNVFAVRILQKVLSLSMTHATLMPLCVCVHDVYKPNTIYNTRTFGLEVYNVYNENSAVSVDLALAPNFGTRLFSQSH